MALSLASTRRHGLKPPPLVRPPRPTWAPRNLTERIIDEAGVQRMLATESNPRNHLQATLGRASVATTGISCTHGRR